MDPRRMCPHCRAFITVKDRVCPYCNETVGPRVVERGEGQPLLGGLVPQARFLTMIILVINFVLYVATTIHSMRGSGQVATSIDGRTLFDFGAKFPPAVAAGQWWRLVTAGFLHGGLMHILMNSWSFLTLGAQVVEVFGTSRMLVIYVCSSVFGFSPSYLL